MLETLLTTFFGSSIGGMLSGGFVLPAVLAFVGYFAYQRLFGGGGGSADLTKIAEATNKFLGYARDWGVYDLLAPILSAVVARNWAAIPGHVKAIYEKFDTPEERRKIADDLAKAQLTLILANPERKASLEAAMGIKITKV